MRDESLGPGRPGSFATGSPRPVESRNRCEAGLLACTVQALIRQGPGGMTPSRAWAQWLCRSVAGTYSCGGSRGLYRVPVLASVWPKNLEAARLRGGWRVVNSWLEICGALATERRAGGARFAHHHGIQGAPFASHSASPQPHQPIDATPAPCSPYTLRSGAPTGVKRETGASQALDQGPTTPVLPPQR